MNEMVSIIVPVYNAAPYLAKTIEMVRKQTYTNWELLLIEDCSLDNSVEVIQQEIDKTLDNRIHLIKKVQNEGAAKARNTGIEAAKGRYLAYLDADDVWLPEKLEKELSFLKQKQAAFVFTAYEFGDEKAQGTGKVVAVPDKLTYQKALSRTVIFTSTVMFDTQKIAKELLFMPEVASEDTASWWKILRSGYTAYGLKEVLVIYRRPEHSLSSNKFTAMKRIWHLYRREEELSILRSAYYFFFWAVRATLRRI